MRILFDLLLAEQQSGTALVSIREMLSIIASHAQEHKYILVTGRPEDYQRQAALPNVCLYPLKLPSKQGILIQHQLQFCHVLQHLQPDVLHVPDGIALIGWHGPLIISMHDSGWLEQKEPLQPAYAQHYRRYLMQESIQRAHALLILSEQIYTMLISSWSIERERIQLITDQKTIPAIYRAVCQGQPLNKSFADHAQLNGKNCSLIPQQPTVSIIIPVSRTKKVECTLQTINQQRYTGQYETILVGPSVEAIASRWTAVKAVNTAQLEKPGKARNLGAAHARGEILLFLDDDITIAENWISHNVHALHQKSIGVVGARILGKSDKFFARCVDFTNFGYYQRRKHYYGPVASASMGVHKELFLHIGGFDPRLDSGEDMDFCYRVQKQGTFISYQPEITVLHDHRQNTLAALLRYNYAHGLAGGLTTKLRHPTSGWKNVLLSHAHFPPLFLLLLPVIAVMATLHIVILNIRDQRRVLLYAPFIFLGKLAYESGIFVKLCQESVHKSAQKAI